MISCSYKVCVIDSILYFQHNTVWTPPTAIDVNNTNSIKTTNKKLVVFIFSSSSSFFLNFWSTNRWKKRFIEHNKNDVKKRHSYLFFFHYSSLSLNLLEVYQKKKKKRSKKVGLAKNPSLKLMVWALLSIQTLVLFYERMKAWVEHWPFSSFFLYFSPTFMITSAYIKQSPFNFLQPNILTAFQLKYIFFSAEWLLFIIALPSFLLLSNNRTCAKAPPASPKASKRSPTTFSTMKQT